MFRSLSSLYPPILAQGNHMNILSFSSSSSRLSSTPSSSFSTSSSVPSSPPPSPYLNTTSPPTLTVLQYTYHKDFLAKRPPLRPSHLLLADKYVRSGKLLAGGAYVEDPSGGLLLFHCDKEGVEQWVKEDPYVSIGGGKEIVKEWRIMTWNVVVNSGDLKIKSK